MRYRTLGNSGIEASVVGFGAWALGGWMWGGTDQNDPVAPIVGAKKFHDWHLLDIAPPRIAPHRIVDAVVKVEMNQVLELGACGREQFLADADMVFHRSANIEKQQQLSPKTWTISPGVVHRQEQVVYVRATSVATWLFFPILRKAPSGEKCDGKWDRKIGATVAAGHPEVERGSATRVST